MNTCDFRWSQRVGYPGHEPPKPAAHPADPKLVKQATQVLKRWICCNYHTWPYCAWAGKNVEVVFEFNRSPDIGHFVEAFFFCPECYAK